MVIWEFFTTDVECIESVGAVDAVFKQDFLLKSSARQTSMAFGYDIKTAYIS